MSINFKLRLRFCRKKPRNLKFTCPAPPRMGVFLLYTMPAESSTVIFSPYLLRFEAESGILYLNVTDFEVIECIHM